MTLQYIYFMDFEWLVTDGVAVCRIGMHGYAWVGE